MRRNKADASRPIAPVRLQPRGAEFLDEIRQVRCGEFCTSLVQNFAVVAAVPADLHGDLHGGPPVAPTGTPLLVGVPALETSGLGAPWANVSARVALVDARGGNAQARRERWRRGRPVACVFRKHLNSCSETT